MASAFFQKLSGKRCSVLLEPTVDRRKSGRLPKCDKASSAVHIYSRWKQNSDINNSCFIFNIKNKIHMSGSQDKCGFQSRLCNQRAVLVLFSGDFMKIYSLL